MTIEKYYSARNKAIKTMALGLIFLLFLPIGIPISLIIIPFLAGRTGGKELTNDWHSTFIITVGGMCSLGFVFIFYLLLSLSLGPSLKIGIAEPTIFGIIISLIWGSFLIGVKNSEGKKTDIQINTEEWNKEEQNEIEYQNEGLAVPKEEKNKKRTVKVNNKEIIPKRDIKDRLADMKKDYKRNKKKTAQIKAKNKKR